MTTIHNYGIVIVAAEHREHQLGYDPDYQYQGTCGANRAGHREKDPASFSDGFPDNFIPWKIILVLVAVLAGLLVLPHLGGMAKGAGEVVRIALYGLGIGMSVAGLYFGVRWAYAVMWRHRERAADFDLERRRKEYLFLQEIRSEQVRHSNRAMLPVEQITEAQLIERR